jgi:predicted dehydrogenase
LQDDEQKPLMVLLSYPLRETSTARSPVVPNIAARPAAPGRIRVAVVGAGGFARGMHLPNLQALARHFHLQAVVSRSGHNALAVAKQFGAGYASTDYQQVLQDAGVDAVIIATRHHLHARMALEALRAGKHVLVEKPLALTHPELDEIQGFYGSAPSTSWLPLLMTGFNRRFSPYLRRVSDSVRGRTNPMIVNYRMNGGYLPLDHWVHTEEGGGRNRGEACHIYDLFTFLTNSRVRTVHAQAMTPRTGYYSRRDNFVATLAFEDGSVASLTYTALGAEQHPKEQMEIFVDGKVLVMNDYRQLTVAGVKAKGLTSNLAQKGHKEELEAFALAIREGGDWPIPLWQQVQATEISFAVESFLDKGDQQVQWKISA